MNFFNIFNDFTWHFVLINMIGGKRAFLDFDPGDLPCDEKHFKTCHVNLMY